MAGLFLMEILNDLKIQIIFYVLFESSKEPKKGVNVVSAPKHLLWKSFVFELTISKYHLSFRICPIFKTSDFKPFMMRSRAMETLCF